MPINLADYPSNIPLRTGQLKRVIGQPPGAGGVAWPGGANYFWADAPTYAVPMRTGPFRSSVRYWLCTYAYCIYAPPTNWTAAIIALRLVGADGGTPTTDLNGIGYLEQYSSFAIQGGSWLQFPIEGKFFCEANQDYYVQFLSAGGGAGGMYYSGYKEHLQMTSYTIGEGVY